MSYIVHELLIATIQAKILTQNLTQSALSLMFSRPTTGEVDGAATLGHE